LQVEVRDPLPVLLLDFTSFLADMPSPRAGEGSEVTYDQTFFDKYGFFQLVLVDYAIHWVFLFAT